MQSLIKPAAVIQPLDSADAINLWRKCSSSDLWTRAGESNWITVVGAAGIPLHRIITNESQRM